MCAKAINELKLVSEHFIQSGLTLAKTDDYFFKLLHTKHAKGLERLTVPLAVPAEYSHASWTIEHSVAVWQGLCFPLSCTTA